MSTEAGNRLLSIGGEFRWPRPDYAVAEAIAAIEAEAIATERVRIAAAVRGLDNCDTDPKYDTVARAAVLAIVEEP